MVSSPFSRKTDKTKFLFLFLSLSLSLLYSSKEFSFPRSEIHHRRRKLTTNFAAFVCTFVRRRRRRRRRVKKFFKVFFFVFQSLRKCDLQNIREDSSLCSVLAFRSFRPFKKFKTRKMFLIKNPARVVFLLLLVANDVESNPGPPNPETKLANLEKETGEISKRIYWF